MVDPLMLERFLITSYKYHRLTNISRAELIKIVFDRAYRASTSSFSIICNTNKVSFFKLRRLVRGFNKILTSQTSIAVDMAKRID